MAGSEGAAVKRQPPHKYPFKNGEYFRDIAIRKIRKNWNVPYSKIAKLFGMRVSDVSDVCKSYEEFHRKFQKEWARQEKREASDSLPLSDPLNVPDDAWFRGH